MYEAIHNETSTKGNNMYNEKEVAKMIEEKKEEIRIHKALLEDMNEGKEKDDTKRDLEELENQLCCLEDGKF